MFLRASNGRHCKSGASLPEKNHGQAERLPYSSQLMTLPSENEAFWRSDDCFIAANPHRPHESDGLAEFAKTSDQTRSLIYFQTSGSEGIPKWCGLSREAMLTSARAVNGHLVASNDDRWLIALPLHHVGGFSIFARCFVSGAGCFQMEEKWNARPFAELCEWQNITLTSLVPTQVFDLVQAELRAPSALRAVVVGGAGLSRKIGRRARELGWPVLQSYGMTETASQVATEPMEDLSREFDPHHLEGLSPWNLSADEDGALTVRGDALAGGYAVKRDGAWRWEPIDRAVGLRTRDRVELSAVGARTFLRFLGRESSFVKIKGELVNLAQMQSRLDALAASHGIAHGSVILWPLPDERNGARLILVGECSDVVLGALRDSFNESAANHERIAQVHRVESIPRSALGKVDALALRGMIGAAQG